ncbi:MAG TPA: translocation/assembly module TamB domain-containing protein, partial [Candidatus Bathyarchaeia archaeon]|nr:translocation/assembly module TamB domain-containing protein [Candidatus Bathyarchaeia archaeon]
MSRGRFHAHTEVHATVKGPLKESAQLQADLTIPILGADYNSLQVRTADPIHVEYAHSVVTLHPAQFRGNGTSLRVQGSIPLSGMSTLNVRAQGSIDASLFRIVEPDLTGSGLVSFDVRTTGSMKSPSLQGQVQLQEVALSMANAPLGFGNLNGLLDIENNRVRISSLSGQAGGGQFSMAGSILYWPNLQFDVSMQAQAVRWRHPSGFRMLLDSNLALTGNSNASILKGRVLIDNLTFTPDFDLTRLGEQLGGYRVPQQAGLGNSVKLSIAVQSKERLSATSSLANVEGHVNLQVVGTAAKPVVVGRSDLTSGE